MRIEELQMRDIQKMEDSELHTLRLQFSQIHSKFWEEKCWPAISKDAFIVKYAALAREMDRRHISKTAEPLDATLFRLYSERIINGESLDLAELDPHPVPGGSRTIKKMILKKDDEEEEPERIVFGVVAEPEEEDTEGDWETEEDIREALYYFMEHDAIFKMNHSGGALDVKLLEAFIAPVDYEIEGQPVKKGSWVQALRVDEDTFEQIEAGELTGFSMAGTAIRIEDEAEE
jgi:hypothetical protein